MFLNASIKESVVYYVHQRRDIMTFSYVDLNSISDEEYEYLLSINEWINKEPQTEVYVVKDHGDIKSVFCLKQDYNFTEKELCFGTRESERNKGYCAFGFNMIMEEVIKTNPSIKGVIIVAINKVTEKLCERLKIPKYLDYYFSNPNFDPKYKELEIMINIRTPLEALVEFCGNDEVMLKVVDLWLERARKKEEELKLKSR